MGDPTVCSDDLDNVIDFRGARFLREVRQLLATPLPSADALSAGILLQSIADQVIVTHQGETKVFACYADLQAAVLVDCRDPIQAQQDAACAVAVEAYRREQLAFDAQLAARRGRLRFERTRQNRKAIARMALVSLAAGLLAGGVFFILEAFR